MTEITDAEIEAGLMGTPEAANIALAEKARAWRALRQPTMATAAQHREMDAQEHEARFQLANAALLWLWHEEHQAARQAQPEPGHEGECPTCHQSLGLAGSSATEIAEVEEILGVQPALTAKAQAVIEAAGLCVWTFSAENRQRLTEAVAAYQAEQGRG